mmetsp:Transcript_1561/g.6219  ORF Transcript_1561/g.6219 Transcript_1561/m.6219 type:complete len:212 (-) Transcript_1561:1085-1720(-)
MNRASHVRQRDGTGGRTGTRRMPARLRGPGCRSLVAGSAAPPPRRGAGGDLLDGEQRRHRRPPGAGRRRLKHDGRPVARRSGQGRLSMLEAGAVARHAHCLRELTLHLGNSCGRHRQYGSACAIVARFTAGCSALQRVDRSGPQQATRLARSLGRQAVLRLRLPRRALGATCWQQPHVLRLPAGRTTEARRGHEDVVPPPLVPAEAVACRG